jgi:hypothetical protein
VHVTELIRKQPLPFELPPLDPEPVSEPEPEPGMLDSLFDPDDQAPSSHRRPPSKGAQVAKIACLGVASVALCAAIAYGSMVNHQRQEQAAHPAPARPPADISGEQALLPDLMNRAVPTSGIEGKAELPAEQTNASDTIDNPGPPRRPAAGVPAPPPDGAEPGTIAPTGPTLSKKETVAQYYRWIQTTPDRVRAFGLLDSNLLGTDLGSFVQSWATVTDVQVLDVREQGNSVLAVVRIGLPDGSHLRVQQLLDVANTVPRRIVGAEILSAQRN